MTRVEPKVFLIAYTKLDQEAVQQWMNHIGGSACLSRVTGSEAEILIELASRRCYRSFDVGLNPNITQIRTDSADYHANTLKSGHGSVFEHATCTWAIEDCSRVFTHELVRNRVGNAFSQESLRYVRLSELRFWLPPEVDSNPVALQIFLECITFLEICQRRLADAFAIDAIKSFSIKKKLTSMFRRIAPIGLATGIVFSCNMRSLRWLIEQRTDEAAEVEMRMIVGKMAEIAAAKWPMIFQDFYRTTVDGLEEWTPVNHKV